MTKIISGKKLFTIATITVFVTGLMLASTLDEAQAKTNNLKCNNVVGSFSPPPATSPFLFTSGIGNCTSFGAVSLAGVYAVTGSPSFDCVTLTSVTDTYVLAKSGDHVMLTAPALTQCFTDATGAPISIATPFCGVGGIAASTVTGAVTVTGGLDNGLPITGGSGTFNSSVNHCAGLSAPFGNSSVTDITGTFTV